MNLAVTIGHGLRQTFSNHGSRLKRLGWLGWVGWVWLAGLGWDQRLVSLSS
jgi:hypothetical protein